jgi:hypothetical protein
MRGCSSAPAGVVSPRFASASARRSGLGRLPCAGSADQR